MICKNFICSSIYCLCVYSFSPSPSCFIKSSFSFYEKLFTFSGCVSRCCSCCIYKGTCSNKR